jgi:predicted DNA-binding transcriptional regulator AlpA
MTVSPFHFLDEVETISGMSNLQLSRLEKQNRFPKRFRIGLRRVAWRKSDVKAWCHDPEAWCRNAVAKMESEQRG